MKNDRLKFRVWSDGDDKPQYVTFVEIYPASYGLVEQCTGLRDSNGQLIYEGDIVECEHDHIGVVKYGEHWQGAFFPDSPCGICPDKKRWQSWTILGNIHDNPELAEATT